MSVFTLKANISQCLIFGDFRPLSSVACFGWF